MMTDSMVSQLWKDFLPIDRTDADNTTDGAFARRSHRVHGIYRRAQGVRKVGARVVGGGT